MTLSDTNREAADKQIEVLKAQTPSGRFLLTLSLSNTVIGLSKRAIKRANPDIADEEVRCRFVELHYGKQLSDQFRRYLNERNDQAK